MVILVALSGEILRWRDGGPERDRFLLSHKKISPLVRSGCRAWAEGLVSAQLSPALPSLRSDVSLFLQPQCHLLATGRTVGLTRQSCRAEVALCLSCLNPRPTLCSPFHPLWHLFLLSRFSYCPIPLRAQFSDCLRLVFFLSMNLSQHILAPRVTAF